MSRVSKIFISLNPVVKPILESRLHCLLSSQFMLVRFEGRKSGKEFTAPMAYHKFDDVYIIALAEMASRQWWRNYRTVWPMELCIKGEWKKGYASLIQPNDGDLKKWYEAVFNRAPFIPKIFGVIYNRKIGLSEDQLEFLSGKSGLVKFTENEKDHI